MINKEDHSGLPPLASSMVDNTNPLDIGYSNPVANDLGKGAQVAFGRSSGGGAAGGGNIFMEAWYGLSGVKSPAQERAEAERRDESILNSGGSIPGASHEVVG